jgi:hypothetical protein
VFQVEAKVAVRNFVEHVNEVDKRVVYGGILRACNILRNPGAMNWSRCQKAALIPCCGCSDTNTTNDSEFILSFISTVFILNHSFIIACFSIHDATYAETFYFCRPVSEAERPTYPQSSRIAREL